MILNRMEKLAMNNPVRAAVHRHYEARKLFALGGPMDGGLALETGCGRGVGVEVILDRFRADRVHAFDLDPDMVARAGKRLAARSGRVRLAVGDITAIDAEDNTYDAAFDFGIIHHVPDWRKALDEVFRVLKPGGRFYTEEVFDRFLALPGVPRLFDHPAHDRFGFADYREALKAVGFRIVAAEQVAGLFGFFIADKQGR